MKICLKCNIEKDLSEYSKNGKYYRGECKLCRTSKEKQKYHENPEYYRTKKNIEYNQNKEIIIERNKEYRKNNSEKVNSQKREYTEKNKEAISLKYKSKEYKDKRNENLKIRRKTDSRFRLVSSYRSRISEILKNTKSESSRLNYLDCSKKDFFDWIEFQFDENMNWDNYVDYWVLDHTIPIAWFNLENEIHKKHCFRWYNLRPFKKEDNLKKSDNIELDTIKKHQEIIDLWYQGDIEIYNWLRQELRYGNNPHGLGNPQPSFLTELKEEGSTTK